MEIYGKVPGRRPPIKLRNMAGENQRGFLVLDHNFILHRNVFFVPLDALVYLRFEDIPGDMFYLTYVPIKKVKKGIRYDCFKYNFKEISDEFFSFEIEKRINISKLKRSGKYLFYEKPNIAVISGEEINKPKKTLQQLLDEAVANQDFERAAKLRDRIEREKRKKQIKNKKNR